MTISDDLIAAYRNTNYCVNTHGHYFTMIVGRVSENSIKLMTEFNAHGAVFITAWNPFGEVYSLTENQKANDLLRIDLKAKKLSVLDGYGASPDGNWREDSFFAFSVSRSTAIKLCNQYSQNAVIFVDKNGIPELIFHPNITFA